MVPRTEVVALDGALSLPEVLAFIERHPHTRYPVFQVASYDQTLPFYLGRPTLLVEYRDEMALGLAAEPGKGYSLSRWFEAWQSAPQAYALMSRATAADLAREKFPFRVLAEDPRRVFVSRR